MSLALTALGAIAGCNTTTQTNLNITQTDPNILATFGNASGIRKEAIDGNPGNRVISLVDNVATTLPSDNNYFFARDNSTSHQGGVLYVTTRNANSDPALTGRLFVPASQEATAHVGVRNGSKFLISVAQPDFTLPNGTFSYTGGSVFLSGADNFSAGDLNMTVDFSGSGSSVTAFKVSDGIIEFESAGNIAIDNNTGDFSASNLTLTGGSVASGSVEGSFSDALSGTAASSAFGVVYSNDGTADGSFPSIIGAFAGDR